MTSSFDCVQAQFRSPIDQSALLFFGRKQHAHNFPTEGVELKEVEEICTSYINSTWSRRCRYNVRSHFWGRFFENRSRTFNSLLI